MTLVDFQDSETTTEKRKFNYESCTDKNALLGKDERRKFVRMGRDL